MTDKVAIFLDVENLSGWLKADGGGVLLERANELGRVVVRRAYGDFSVPSVSTRQSELNLLGFEFVHVYHPAKGKNSADIQIVVDVMEYLARIPDLEWVVLATGDSDFSPLFRRLRELGKSVVGVGPRSALSEAVKKSCNRFIYIDKKSESGNSETSLKVDQLREDALDLLERVLSRFTEGANLSVLKNAMLELDSAFDEQNIGFSGFLKFLKSAPEIVNLYQVKKTWYAKSIETNNDDTESSSARSEEGTPLNNVTPALYKRYLRKSGWRSCEISLLWSSLHDLSAHFPDGFTRQEELDYLTECHGHNRTRTELRAVVYILYKTDFVIQQHHNEGEEPVLTVKIPESEQILAEKVDIVMMQKLSCICKSNNVPFIPEKMTTLLNRNYAKEKINILAEIN